MAFIQLTEANVDQMTALLLPMTGIYVREALALGYDVAVSEEANLAVATKGKQQFFIHGNSSPLNNAANASVADNKLYTGLLLEHAGIPTARKKKLSRKMFLLQNWSITPLNYPLVVKPLKDTSSGYGVTTNIQNSAELEHALTELFEEFSSVLIEEYHSGLKDYRVMVLNGEVIAVTERVPAYVTGDGSSTIEQLIESKNAVRAEKFNTSKRNITIDRELQLTLASEQLNMQCVPAKNERIALKHKSNLNTGGESIDRTDDICQENIDLAVEAAQVIGLYFAGLDFLCEDIGKPISNAASKGVILEVNHFPGVIAHHFPSEGQPRPVARKIMEALFI